MPSKKLKQAPLKEVVFEIFWKKDSQNEINYDFALGRFQYEIQNRFPIIKRILPPGIKIQNQTAYQFWTKQGVFPVIQFGDGVLTVNDTDKSYTWDNFREHVSIAMNACKKSFGKMPEVSFARLKYLDSVDVSPNDDIELMIQRNHLTKITPGYKLPGSFRGLSITQSRTLPDTSVLVVSINNAINSLSKKNSIVWTSLIERSEIGAEHELTTWLDMSHETLSNLFVEMLDPKYYEQFNQ